MGGGELDYILPIITKMRAKGLSAEIYPENAKLRKQFEYADKKGIEFVIIVGDEEIASNTLSIKNMRTGEQSKVSTEEIA
jgi:histidyl-tRNA synthetase